MKTANEVISSMLIKMGYDCEIIVSFEKNVDLVKLNGKNVMRLYQPDWVKFTEKEIQDVVKTIARQYEEPFLLPSIVIDEESEFSRALSPHFSDFVYIPPEEYLAWDATKHREWGIHLVNQLISYDEITPEQVEWLLEYVSYEPEMCLPMVYMAAYRSEKKDDTDFSKRFLLETPLPLQRKVSLTTLMNAYCERLGGEIERKLAEWGLSLEYVEEPPEEDKYYSVVENEIDC